MQPAEKCVSRCLSSSCLRVSSCLRGFRVFVSVFLYHDNVGVTGDWAGRRSQQRLQRADEPAKNYRDLDARVQELNWQTELV